MDEERGVASGRNPINSINEVLREGRIGRDKAKVNLTLLLRRSCFKPLTFTAYLPFWRL